VAKTKTGEIKDIPKPEWECYTCGSQICDYIFDKKIWKWRIVKTYHFTGFWRQNKKWVYVGEICPETTDVYCKECGAIHPRHYPMCSRLSEDTKQRYELMRRKSRESQKRYEFKGIKNLADSKKLKEKNVNETT